MIWEKWTVKFFILMRKLFKRIIDLGFRKRQTHPSLIVDLIVSGKNLSLFPFYFNHFYFFFLKNNSRVYFVFPPNTSLVPQISSLTSSSLSLSPNLSPPQTSISSSSSLFNYFKFPSSFQRAFITITRKIEDSVL